MNDLQQALNIIETFLNENQISSASAPDGIYYSVDEKRQICEKFDEIKNFINNS